MLLENKPEETAFIQIILFLSVEFCSLLYRIQHALF